MGKKVSKLTESEGRRTLKKMKTVGPVDISVQVFGRGAKTDGQNCGNYRQIKLKSHYKDVGLE